MRVTMGHIISFTAGVLVCGMLFCAGSGAPARENQRGEIDVLRLLDARLQPAQGNPDALKSNRAAPPAQPADKNAAAGVSNDTVECCLKVAQDIDSHLAARLREQQADNPDGFAVQLQINGQRLLDLCALRTEDPVAYDTKLQAMRFDAQVLRAGRELREAIEKGDNKAQKPLEDELRGLLQMQLVFEIKARGDLINHLEDHLRRLRAELATMSAQFNTTVETRLAEIRDGSGPLNPSWKQGAAATGAADVNAAPPE